MKLKHKYLIACIVFLTAWVFDQLFWNKNPGISVPLFVLLYLVGLYFITVRLEGRHPATASLWLVVPCLLFAVLEMVRLEPFTSFVNLVMLAVCLLTITLSWLGGKWSSYSISDWMVRSATLAGLGLVGPLQVFLGEKDDSESSEGTPTNSQAPVIRRTLASVALGLVMALPVVILLGALLAGADPVFGKQLEEFLRYFSVDNLREYLVRFFIILVVGYAMLGTVLFSLLHTKDEKLIGLQKPWLSPFLNGVSSGIVLLSIDILFLVFVIVQFQYFFGGQANISYAGYTYSEYARRGFGELVGVALISMVVFLSMAMFTRRLEGWKRHTFSALGLVLVLLVGVMLVSAFQRLNLYETAYGFSRLRAYTSVFLVWLGILLALTVVLQWSGRLRAFSLAVLLVGCGFALSLTVLNIDGFITRSNLSRAIVDHNLDTRYLINLSKDNVPDLFDVYLDPAVDSQIRKQTAIVLRCQQLREDPQAWPSFHFSHYRAQSLFGQYGSELLQTGTPYKERGLWHLLIDGDDISCQNFLID